MANELLDFVMAVVGDPATAARYAQDPAGALADAALGDVTTADVDNLIPLVAESFATAMPGAGAVAADSNVWASGAATAAFDAFDFGDGLGGSGVEHPAGTVITLPGIDTGVDVAAAASGPVAATPDQLTASPYGDAPVDAGAALGADDAEPLSRLDGPDDDAAGYPGHPVDTTFDLF